MALAIDQPIVQTVLVGIVLAAILLFSIRKKRSLEILPLQTTQELKGVAILAILFGHIGYSLFPHQTFLFPLSVFAGMGVDVFLFLSGFGLTCSQITKPIGRKDFYKKRFSKLFFSLWVILLLFLLLDFFVLRRSYSLSEVILSFLGIFPRADLIQNINSPLWYITFILFYYLLFPIFFSRKNLLFSALGIFFVSWILLQLALPIDFAVKNLYYLHIVAFPLGILCAGYWPHISRFIGKRKKHILSLLVIFSTICLFYFGIHSGVGKGIVIEQGISLFLVLCTLLIFILKQFEFRFLSVLGIYSHEMYLLHWPILSRYDFLYTFFPAGIATLLSLAFLLCISFLLAKLLYKLPLLRQK